jgi:DNA topoisomerase-1
MPVVKKLGIPCPSCGKELVERRSRKGKLFYGCMGYPECNQVYWDRPVKEKCPKCGALMTEKRTKSSHIVRCTDSECGYSESVQES